LNLLYIEAMKIRIFLLCIWISEAVFSQDHATIKIGASFSNSNFDDLVTQLDYQYSDGFFRYTQRPVKAQILSVGLGSRFIDRFVTIWHLKANVEGGLKLDLGSLRMESQKNLNPNAQPIPYFQLSLYTEGYIRTDKQLWLGLGSQFSQGGFTVGRYFELRSSPDDSFIETQFRMRSIQVDALLRFHINKSLSHAITFSAGYSYGIATAQRAEMDQEKVNLSPYWGQIYSIPVGLTYSYFISNKLDRSIHN
jgi:hypothetical protein